MAAIEPLTEEEAYLWAILSDASGLDQAEWSWYNAEDEETNCFRAWPFQWAWWRNISSQQIDQCFPGDSLVLTERGNIPLEDVVIGDRVLTHKGDWKSVTWIYYQGERELVEVKGHGHWGLKTTVDHEFYLQDGFGVPDKGDLWATPREFPDSVVPEMPERLYKPGRPSNVPHNVNDPKFLWLYGLFLAEGSCSSSFGNGGTVNRTTFSVHTDEVSYVETVLDAVGLRYNTNRVAQEECFNIVINSRQLAEWMSAYGGRGARKKSLASWALGLSWEQREAILSGAAYGDGYRRNVRRVEYTTTSRTLAVGLKLLAQTVGNSVTINSNTKANSVIDGRVIKGGVYFTVSWHMLDENSRQKVTVDGIHLRSSVYSVVETNLVERCYDLEVEDDHSYVLDGIVVHNCARSVGKSLSIKVRAYAFPFIHPGQEMVITAPEGNHLDAVTDVTETAFVSNRLGREMIMKTRSGIKHRPFHMNFSNGSRIMGRIPQRDGKGVKGIHPIWLELDEAQDYPKDGWIEIFETLKQGHDGAVWRAHGVTRGVRDFFYDFTKPDSGWQVHRFTAMHRPTWSDEIREKQIKKYGSADHPDYRRNVLGLHGDATNPLFVLHRLMACVDDDMSSEFNDDIYTFLKINNEMVLEYNDDILSLIDFPQTHLKYKHIWMGMDVGYTNDPSEILVFAEIPGKKKDDPSVLQMISRVAMQRVNHENQVRAILWLIHFYKPHIFAMDKTGLGLPLFQDIQERAKKDPNIKHLLGSIKGYNFSEKILVDIDASVDVEDPRNEIQEAGVHRNVLEYSTDVLRDLVDSKRLWLPFDKELIAEFQGQTFSYDKAVMDLYGRSRNFSKGTFHTLDAARMMACGWRQHKIDQFVAEKQQFTPVTSIFL